ncbi:ABC1 kinase family protein [Clostridium saccharobutylicum]|nr:AarF/UbiB family protein [Clostridium saccharobutylicum]MBA9012473.1 ubiquinone biosynthesis protein [Clostridium saccharobutylicum]
MNEAFKEINFIPIASASIAQVYEGILNDDREVVIKIQRPDIYKNIQLDIAILIRILRFTKAKIKMSIIDPIEVLEEIESSTREELNFVLEADNIKRFREYNKNVAPVYAPYVIEELLSDRVLVLEKINGFKINSTQALRENGYDTNDIANKLALSYCKQVFEDGFFHGDPHPGNILISRGKLCFLDFGIMGHINHSMKKWLNLAIISIATKDKERLVNCILSIGIKKGKVNKLDLYDAISYMFDTYLETSIKNIKISVLMQEIWHITIKNNIQLPKELVSLIRSLIILEGVVSELDPELEIVNVIVSFIRSKNRFVILNCLEKEELVISMYSFVRDSIKIPSKTLEVLNKLSAGESKVELKVKDISNIIIQINKMVNRITQGILISALILSSSLIISNNVKPTYNDISLIGIIGYIIAFIFAIKLLISMAKACEYKKNNKK